MKEVQEENQDLRSLLKMLLQARATEAEQTAVEADQMRQQELGELVPGGRSVETQLEGRNLGAEPE